MSNITSDASTSSQTIHPDVSQHVYVEEDALFRRFEEIQQQAIEGSNEVILRVLYDATVDSVEALTNLEMAQYTERMVDDDFYPLGPVNFADVIDTSEQMRAAFIYLACLRIKIYDALGEAGLIPSSAYEMKMNESLFWYLRLTDIQRDEPSTWMN